MMKLKKNAFTLLELLAVIVVLAIIALIVSPFVSKAIRQAKKDSFKNSAYGIISAAELYYGGKMVNQDFTTTLISIQNKEISPQTFKYKGSKIEKGYIEIDEKGKIKMYLWNEGFCAKKDFNKNEVEITTDKKDECTLDGPSSPIIESSSNGWTSGDVTIRITSIDEVEKYQYNISKDEYSYDSNKWVDTTESEILLNSENINENGEYYIYVRSVDEKGAGEVSKVKVQIDRSQQTVEIISSTGGSISKDKESYLIGEKVTLTLTPTAGYALKKIEGTNGVSITKENDNTYSFIMKKGPIQITYELEKLEFNITLNQAEGGTITGPNKAIYGDTVNISVSPSTGYRLKSLSYNDGTSHDITSTKEFTMGKNNTTINVEWELYIIIKYRTRTLTTLNKTYTDLVNWNVWQKYWYNISKQVNESASNPNYQGWIIYNASPGIGVNDPGWIYQDIVLEKGHKYYVHAAGQGVWGGTMRMIAPGYDQTVNAPSVNKIFTPAATATYRIGFYANNSTSDYVIARYADIVDLTSATGIGYEPDLSFCQANLGWFNGSKTVATNNQLSDWSDWTTSVCNDVSTYCQSSECLASSASGTCVSP